MKSAMIKKCICLVFCLMAVGHALSQKEYKTLRTYIKKGGNLAQTMAVVQAAEKDDELKDDPELYFLAACVQRKANDAENTKIYLKQAYDTVSFFNTTYGMFDYLIKCDQKDQLPDAKGKVKIRYRSRSYNILKDYYSNIYNAGLFFTQKKDYQNGRKFFSMYIDAASTPIFEKDHLLENDNMMPRAAFWCMANSFELKDYANVFKYSDLAARDTANTDLYLQYRAISYAALKQMDNYEKELLRGMKEEPNDMFFFTNLTDYYNSTHNYAKSLSLADSMLQMDGRKNIYKFAKTVVLYHLKDYNACINLATEVLAADSANADAYFYAGSSYFSQAVEIDDNIKPNINAKEYAAQKSRVKEIMKTALPYLERYKALRPDDKDRWAPLLYRTYLTLNMGKQFAEIDKLLLQEQEAQKKK